jgi:TonB family protein
VLERLLSFFAALCLHLILFIVILFWPAPAARPRLPTGILIEGLVSVNPLPGAPARTIRRAVSPAEPVRTAQASRRPEEIQPRPSVTPAREPSRRETVIPSRAENRQAPDTPAPPAETPRNATLPPARNATRPPARNASSTPPPPPPPAEDVNSALAEMRQASRRSPAAGRGEDLSRALAALDRELNSANQGGGGGAEDGAGLGLAGAYADSVASRIKPNWAMAERADRANYIAIVSLSIGADGLIRSAVIKSSSGNGLFDASILQAVRATRQVEPPPGPEYFNMDITFSRDVLSRR